MEERMVRLLNICADLPVYAFTTLGAYSPSIPCRARRLKLGQTGALNSCLPAAPLLTFLTVYSELAWLHPVFTTFTPDQTGK